MQIIHNQHGNGLLHRQAMSPTAENPLLYGTVQCNPVPQD